MSTSETNAFFRVTGGSPLSGEITPQGNKNEALPLLAAACLTREPVTLENLRRNASHDCDQSCGANSVALKADTE